MYFVIGISLLFAYLLGINLIVTLISMAIWRTLSPRSDRWRPVIRSNVVFLLRTLPVAVAVISIGLFIIPSYLLFEPYSSGETVSWKLGTVVALSAIGLLAAIGRIAVSRLRTRRLLRDWLVRSRPIRVQGVELPVYQLENSPPVIAVVGVFRPRVFVASELLGELEAGELAAAVAHEAGHVTSRDNLKRSVLRTCGDLLIYPIGGELDRCWSRSAEMAADEFVARAGGRRTALDLASALIKIGRMTSAPLPNVTPLGSFLIDAHSNLLSARIERLLRMADSTTDPIRGGSSRTALVMAVLVFAILINFAIDPQFLAQVHSTTESILAILS